VAALSGGNFPILARQSTWPSILAVGCAFWWFAAGAEAGIILSCAADDSAARIDVNLDSTASSSGPQKSGPDQEDARESDHAASVFLALDGLVESGGASAPISGSVGPLGAVPVAILDVPATALAPSSFASFRENQLKAPQPPPGELLDPPKDR